MTKKIILVVAAHPDDETLGCGATIARMAQEGNSVHILILGEGITSREKKVSEGTCHRKLAQLHRQAKLAAKILHARSIKILNFPDNRFDTVALLDLVKAVENEKRRLRPEIVLTHHGQDLNVDHRLTCQAVLTACRPVTRESVREIYSFEIPSSTEWQAQSKKKVFCPTFYIELKKKHLAAKIRALKVYSSELKPFPHPRSIKAIDALAKWRGSNAGVSYAECFEIIRKII